MSPTGATRLYPILGDPIAQVKSPGGVSRALAERGRDALCVPMRVTTSELTKLIDSLEAVANIDGIIVTVPHKFACFALCASTSPRAEMLGAVNVMRRRPEGGWHGDMFDGAGFVRAQIAGGARLRDARALLVGAGGAGTAIGFALLGEGVRELVVHDSDTDRVDTLIGRLRAHGDVRSGTADPAGFDIICNATPAGMRSEDPLPVPVERLRPNMFVGEVITAPAVTPLLEAARAIGCGTQTGGAMYSAVETLMIDFFAENWS